MDADGFNKPLVKNVCIGRVKSEANETVWDETVVTWHAMYFFSSVGYLMFSFATYFFNLSLRLEFAKFSQWASVYGELRHVFSRYLHLNNRQK